MVIIANDSNVSCSPEYNGPMTAGQLVHVRCPPHQNPSTFLVTTSYEEPITERLAICEVAIYDHHGK